MKPSMYGRRNLQAYLLWIIGAILTWQAVYWLTYYAFLPLADFLPATIMYPAGNGLPWAAELIVPAVIAWLVLQTIIPDRYLSLIIVVTILGHFVGNFLEQYVYVFAVRSLHLISGNTVRIMFLENVVSYLIIAVIIAIFQVLFIGLILKRIGWGFAIAWVVAAIIAGAIAPVCSVAFQLNFYAPSSLYPDLIQSVIFGTISGLPLIWLRVRTREKVEMM
jgi:hypothetical protein